MKPNRVGISIGRKTLTRAILEPAGDVRFDVISPESIWAAPGDVVSVARNHSDNESKLPPLPLRCLTLTVESVADVFGVCAFTAAGDRIEVWRDEVGSLKGRITPTDLPDDDGNLTWNDRSIPMRFAAALAAVACDPDRVRNLASRRPGARAALLARLREPVLNLAAAAALLFAGIGIWCQRDIARQRDELAEARHVAAQLWTRVLPGETPRDHGLAKAMLLQIGELGAEKVPSALAFWAEIGRLIPDVDGLGLDIESLDLTPEGGRLSARVPAAKDDPLKNAAALEGHLNQSETLRARGDYEVRDGHVQVRLRLEFKP